MKKGKYKVSIRGKAKLVEVDGYLFDIFGYGQFVVHRDLQWPTMWSVSEVSTGLTTTVANKTKKSAIETATTAVCSIGSDSFQKRLTWYKEHGWNTGYDN